MIQPTRRSVVAALAAVACSARDAFAQAWPSAQTTIVVPFPAGGSVDAIARLVQTGLQQRLATTIIIENKAGAQGSIGAAQVVKARPDGGTWLFVFDTHAVNPSLQNLPFDTEKDLAPVLLIGTAPHILCCHPSRAWKSFADLKVAAVADPGKLTYASIGTGSLGHLTGVELTKRAGISMTHVPYRGGGPALNDAVAGHVDAICASSALVAAQIAGGALRPLLQTGKARLAGLPGSETAQEAGFPGFESYAWWGVFAPKDTPALLIERFGAELVAVMKDANAARQLAEVQQIDTVFGGPAVLRDWLARQTAIWGAVVREHGIKAGN